MDHPHVTSPLERRPSLRPLLFLVGALAAVWLAAIGLIVVQIA